MNPHSVTLNEMTNAFKFLFSKSQSSLERYLGVEPVIELLESDGMEISDCEDYAAADEFGAPVFEVCEPSPFGEPYNHVFFVESDRLTDALESGVPGPAFVWKEPRDWFAPVRNASKQVAAGMVAAGQAASGDLQHFQQRWATGQLRAMSVASEVVDALVWLVQLPGRTVDWIESSPKRFANWFVSRPWDYLLSVRRGFAFGAIAGFSVFGSTIWAISSVPYLTGHMFEPTSVMPAYNLPIPRGQVPQQLAWFFIQFPYVSEKAKIKPKNLHTYVITDPERNRDYVVTLGQRYRRVEIYGQDAVDGQQVQIFTPGYKKTVWFQGARMIGESKSTDANLWMWKGPLWNQMHVKIYGLADMWMDSPYKRYSCAGFVHKFLKDAGIHVPIKDAWDMAKLPYAHISREEMEPGDIITIRAANAAHRRFWRHNITHVGVYIGHGKMIHAATSMKAPRAWIRIADVDVFRGRIDKILRPPELL